MAWQIFFFFFFFYTIREVNVYTSKGTVDNLTHNREGLGITSYGNIKGSILH